MTEILIATIPDPTLDKIYATDAIDANFNEGELAKVEFDCSRYDPVIVAQRFNEIDQNYQASHVELWSKSTIKNGVITSYPKTGFPVAIAVAVGFACLTLITFKLADTIRVYKVQMAIVNSQIEQQEDIWKAYLSEIDKLSPEEKIQALKDAYQGSTNTLDGYFDKTTDSANSGLLDELGLGKYMPILIIGLVAVAGLFIFLNFRR